MFRAVHLMQRKPTILVKIDVKNPTCLFYSSMFLFYTVSKQTPLSGTHESVLLGLHKQDLNKQLWQLRAFIQGLSRLQWWWFDMSLDLLILHSRLNLWTCSQSSKSWNPKLQKSSLLWRYKPGTWMVVHGEHMARCVCLCSPFLSWPHTWTILRLRN